MGTGPIYGVRQPQYWTCPRFVRPAPRFVRPALFSHRLQAFNQKLFRLIILFAVRTEATVRHCQFALREENHSAAGVLVLVVLGTPAAVG